MLESDLNTITIFLLPLIRVEVGDESIESSFQPFGPCNEFKPNG
jgi:hypothetical protein